LFDESDLGSKELLEGRGRRELVVEVKESGETENLRRGEIGSEKSKRGSKIRIREWRVKRLPHFGETVRSRNSPDNGPEEKNELKLV
jgi:hypothetical protein